MTHPLQLVCFKENSLGVFLGVHYFKITRETPIFTLLFKDK